MRYVRPERCFSIQKFYTNPSQRILYYRFSLSLKVAKSAVSLKGAVDDSNKYIKNLQSSIILFSSERKTFQQDNELSHKASEFLNVVKILEFF